MRKLQHRVPIALELDWYSNSKMLLSKVCSLRLQPPFPLSYKPYPGVCISFHLITLPSTSFHHVPSLNGSYAIIDGQDDRRPPGISDNSMLTTIILDTFLTQ